MTTEERRTTVLAQLNDRAVDTGVSPYILMLVPHDPDLDPRVRWVCDLCVSVCQTDVIGSVLPPDPAQRPTKPRAEQAGRLYLERIEASQYASWPARLVFSVVYALPFRGAVQRYLDDQSSGVADPGHRVGGSGVAPSHRSPRSTRALLGKLVRCMSPWRLLQRCDRHLGACVRFLLAWSHNLLIASALFRRSRSVSVRPRLIICHDLVALAAANKLKSTFNVPIIYDSHELWPEADLLARQWEKRVTSFVEQRLIRETDVVITVTPQLAQVLERRYGIPEVLSVPNAEPLRNVQSEKVVSASRPVTFLYQGQAARRRGLEGLLSEWRHVSAKQAVLYLRCPENEFLMILRTRFDDLIQAGVLKLLEPASENELINAAKIADVGIIPYPPHSLNHIMCCPNKLSQYMQAGLAVLTNKLVFVAEVIQRYQCGLVYNSDEPESVLRHVEYLGEHPNELAIMKRNAREAARSEFNWQRQAAPYLSAIKELYLKAS